MKSVFVIGMFFVFAISAFASHSKGGEILIKQDSADPLKFTATVYMFYDPVSVSTALLDSIQINWGDGMIEYIPGIETDILSQSYQRVTYEGAHTYQFVPSDSVVSVSVSQLNRITGILNINNGASVEVPLYVETVLNLRQLQFTVANTTARFNASLPMTAYVLTPFHYDLLPVDEEGDVYAIELTLPLQSAFESVVNYSLPETTLGGNFNISDTSLDWNSPQQCGYVAIGLRINEYRNGKWLSSTLRDALIQVRCESNVIPIVPDRRTILYPNPAFEVLSLNHPGRINAITLYDVNGRNIPVNRYDDKLEIQNLSPGVYWLEIESADSYAFRQFIKH